jgi:hypothetical protein
MHETILENSSTISDRPRACVISTMYCACMSVGKLGCGAVETLPADNPSGQHVTSSVVGFTSSITTPTSRNLANHRLQMIRATVFDLELPIGDCGGDDESSGLYSVGDDRVFRAAECFHAFDLDRFRPGAVHARPHFVQQLGEIDDLRFPRALRRVVVPRRALPPSSGFPCR